MMRCDVRRCRPNIPISRNTTSIPASITASLDYVPPHPSPESPYHRYTLLLLRQPTPTLSSSDKEKGDKLDSSATTAFLPTTPQDRSTFNLREWMIENNFSTSPSDANSVKGIFMFREGGKGFGQNVGYKRTSKEWKEEERVVDGVWKEVWGRERAVYEKSPKEERFGYPMKY
jgi:large subunit ribosomal protein L35